MSHKHPPSWRRRALASVPIALGVAVVAVLSPAACGVNASLVGGDCAAGYTDCNDVCIPTTSDPNNCGGCGIVCSSGRCMNSQCVGVLDASSEAASDARSQADGARRDGGAQDAFADSPHEQRDGSSSDARSDAPADAMEASATDGSKDALHGDAPLSDAKGSDVGVSDAHSSDGHISDASGVDQCAPPYVTTSSCGACGAACGAGLVCSPSPDAGVDAAADAGAYSCAMSCFAPYFACDGTCIVVADDPDNCGACGKVCVSGICVQGVCAGATSGDIVVIGHDYAAASVHQSEATVLANAVFLPMTNPLRVLSFEEYAEPAQLTNVKNVLKAAATALGRTVNITSVVDPTLVPGDLSAGSYDVLLVPDQATAPAGTLGPVGMTWQTSLNAFLLGGGDVVVLDGASGGSPQMASFLSAANLLATTGEVPIAGGTQLLVVASGDAVGNSVVSPYAAQADTVSFVTSEVNGGSVTYVVDELSGGMLVPVVIHKTVAPP